MDNLETAAGLVREMPWHWSWLHDNVAPGSAACSEPPKCSSPAVPPLHDKSCRRGLLSASVRRRRRLTLRGRPKGHDGPLYSTWAMMLRNFYAMKSLAADGVLEQ